MTEQIDHFDVFLCHNSADKLEVMEVGEMLKARGLNPWLDAWNLRPGTSLLDALEEQIERITAAAVFIGSNDQSQWQRRETNAYLLKFLERGCPVIPVLLKSAPKVPSLPIFLKEHTWVDFREVQPDPIDRLIWGITGEVPARLIPIPED